MPIRSCFVLMQIWVDNEIAWLVWAGLRNTNQFNINVLSASMSFDSAHKFLLYTAACCCCCTAARFLIFSQTQTNRSLLCNKNVNKQISLLIWIIKVEIMFFFSQLLLVLSAYICASCPPDIFLISSANACLCCARILLFFLSLPSRCLLHPIDIHIHVDHCWFCSPERKYFAERTKEVTI